MSLDFIGNGQIDLGQWDSINGKSQATIMCYMSGPGKGAYKNVITRGTAAGTDSWGILLGNQSRFVCRFQINGSLVEVNTASKFYTTGQIYHVCAVYDGSTVKLYSDGVEVGSAAASGPITEDPTQIVAISGVGGASGTQPHEGYASDIRLYNRALSIGEIDQIRRCNGQDGIHYGLEGWWMLNEFPDGATVDVGSRVVDYGPYQRHGSMITASVSATRENLNHVRPRLTFQSTATP